MHLKMLSAKLQPYFPGRDELRKWSFPELEFPHWGVSLTHWGRVTHICVSKLTLIGSDNGLWPCRCQAISWTNAVILLIEPLGINFSEILIEIHIFSFKKIHLKMSSAKWHPFCLGLNVLRVLHCSTPAVQRSVYWHVIMVAADFLAPYRFQGISNHHADKD